MSWIDWIIVAILAFSILQGLRRGALAAGGSALGVVIAYLAASYWYASLADSFGFIPLSPPWQATVAFLVLFLAVNGILAIAASLLLGAGNASPLSRMIGAALGIVRGTLLAAALLTVAMASPLGEPVTRDVARSPLAAPVAKGEIATVEWLRSALPPSIPVFGGGAARF
ncbi:MAG TPA: CvpA family protein [bacterium]